jgi:hypothetical protein
MREAETDSHEGKRKVEALWPIFKIHHQKSRYIYDLFYRRKAISRGSKLVFYPHVPKNLGPWTNVAIFSLKWPLYLTYVLLVRAKNIDYNIGFQEKRK